MIVSPGMSLVAAGVASGICFIIFSSLRKGRAADLKKETKQIIADDSHCACCFKPLLLERGVRCNDCVARSCRKSCSRWDTSDNAWRCLFCHQRRYWLRRNEKWFESFGRALIEDRDLHRYFSTAKSRVYFEGVENAAGSSKLAVPEENQENAHTMEMVRDFVEKIIEGLIGSVDDASIDRIYDHPTYDKLLAKYIVPLTGALARMTVALQLALTKLIEEMLALIGGLIVAYIFYVLITRRNDKPNTDSPEMAHTALRDIVERAVEEARKLPGLGGPKVTETEGKNIAEHSYEDLLATAILNKVIEKFQKEQVDGNSNVLHEKPASRTKCTLSESELRLDEGVEEGCSSLEPLSQDDCTECSATCSRHVRNKPEPLSLTIEERIEEVTTTYTSDEEHRDNDVLPIRNAHRVPFPELGMDIIDPSQDSSEDSQDELDSPTAHVDMVSPVESWEENWLFQKKRVQTQPDPVAMLVPNFSADFKALIGDKDAEDTSDLSECSSAQSDEEIEKELMEAISNVVPRPPKKEEFDVEHPSSDRTQDIGSEEMFTRENTGDLSKDTSNEEKTEKFEKSEKTDARISKESVKNEEKLHENGIQDEKIIEGKIESVQISNMSKETKEIKEPSIMKMEINGDEIQDGKFIDEHFEAAFEDTSKLENGIGNEKVKSQRESKETMQNSSTLDVSEKTETKNLTEKNSINSNATDTTLVPEVGMVSEVPKTPTSTPTRTSVTEGSQEVNNEEETLVRMDESVLNSLESAKKKLMVVDDDAIEAFKEEAKPLTQHKADFHTEDIQQESEYTEHYDIATQRHLDSLTKCDTFSEADIVNDKEQGQDHQNDNSRCREAVAFAKAESASYLSQEKRKQEEEEVQLAAPPRPGTIAEREHKKWENAPPIENNPYSEENIQKRLWERQYARRSSDIPGIHAELPKSNDAELDVVLRHQEPDIKRFGRDYYINDAKSPSGERGMRRSATSISSRPSSSLSQQSSSTEHEQQVSYELEKFEEASLRGSLSRWRYRDPHSSPHFAINPLLRLEFHETNESALAADRSRINDNRDAEKHDNEISPWNTEERKDSSKIAQLTATKLDENVRKCNGERIREDVEKVEENSRVLKQEVCSKDTIETECKMIPFKVHDQEINDVPSTTSDSIHQVRDSFLNDSIVTMSTNPLYGEEEDDFTFPERSNPDRDSGMYSIESNEPEIVKDIDKRGDTWKRSFWLNDSRSNGVESQILSFNGKKYWNTGGYKYHTFGGIKNTMVKGTNDDSEEDGKLESPDEFNGNSSFDVPAFANFKFQTFGGIKGGKKIDGRGLPTYRRLKLRPTLKTLRNTKDSVKISQDSLLNESILTVHNNDVDRRLIDDLQKDDVRNGRGISGRSSKTGFNFEERSSSSSGSIEEDWLDEDMVVSDKMIMSKFLKDVTIRTRTRNEDSNYFVNTSRRTTRRTRGSRRRSKSRKHRSFDENDSLKLEPPIVPEVIERTFETLNDLRSSARKGKLKDKEKSKKLGVRSLSDVTIW